MYEDDTAPPRAVQKSGWRASRLSPARCRFHTPTSRKAPGPRPVVLARPPWPHRTRAAPVVGTRSLG